MGLFADENKQKDEESIFSKLKQSVSPEKVEIEGTGYQRRTLDRRIEKHLDRNFNEYVEKYDLVRELHLRDMEEKLENCEDKSVEINEFQKDIQADIDQLDRDIEMIKEEMG